MGTNFYWLPDITGKNVEVGQRHIGKRSSIGNGKTKFIYNEPPFLVYMFLIAFRSQEVAEDEYGNKWTGQELAEALAKCEDDPSYVDEERFS